MVLGLMVSTIPVAWADTAYGFNYSGCNFSGTGSKFSVKTRVTAWDGGRTVKLPGGKNSNGEYWNTAYLHTYKCDSYNDTNEPVTFRWTIKAYGWGISCGAGLPPGASCTSFSEGKQIVWDFSGRTGDDGVLQRSIGAGDPWSFEDGAVGDTEKVCSTLRVFPNNSDSSSISASACADAD